MKTTDFTEDINGAARALEKGGIVAIPTETVYGLAANAYNEDAIKKLFELKGRPENKPLSVMVSGVDALDRLCYDVPEAARTLAEAFWPGPLTIVLKAKEGLPDAVRAGGDTVGIRCPQNGKTLELLRQLPFPLAVPSANPSGSPAATTASRVLDYFSEKIDGYMDGGQCGIGRESTVVDMSCTPYRILRQGAESESDIKLALIPTLTIIGITGGTGCGKTTALETLCQMGACTLDADGIYHQLLAESRELRCELEERFPGVLPEGRIDTKELGKLVFSDQQALSDLSAITHRFVGEEILCRLSEWAFQGGRVAAIDAIALLESGIGSICKARVAVTAPVEEKIRRIMEREGISRDYAVLRVEAQKPNEYFQSACDRVIANDTTPERFAEECKRVFSEILREE